MVLFAFSLSDQVEKYGAYVGIACFFGLAVLSLLYFAQAREVKRLRDWAGRAPELGSELEQAVREFEDRLRRAPVARPQPQPVAVPEPVVANGAVKLKPAEVAALAFARSAGVREPHEPKHHPPVRVAAAAVAAAGRAATPQVATPAPAPAPAPVPAAAPTNGGGGGAVPPPPLPARRPRPRRAASSRCRRAARRPAARRPAPPPRRESNTRAVVLTAIIGVLVLAGAAFGATQLLGGERRSRAREPRRARGAGRRAPPPRPRPRPRSPRRTRSSPSTTAPGRTVWRPPFARHAGRRGLSGGQPGRGRRAPRATARHLGRDVQARQPRPSPTGSPRRSTSAPWSRSTTRRRR